MIETDANRYPLWLEVTLTVDHGASPDHAAWQVLQALRQLWTRLVGVEVAEVRLHPEQPIPF